MPDMSSISAFLTSVKIATDLAKLLKEADNSLESAEWKMKFADLTFALADLKIYASEIKDVIAEKDSVIKELSEALLHKAEVVKWRDAYFQRDEHGRPQGDPYCLNCWEAKHKLNHLKMMISSTGRECPSCGTKYSPRHVHYREGE